MFGVNEKSKLKTDLGFNGFPVSLNYFTALPDVQELSNAQIAIIFKSLLKKDSTTKEKALTDFQKLFEDELYADDLKQEDLIKAWIQMYAKLAFDNSKNVRLLSHKLQALLLNHIGGKHFSKYLKSSLPIWLLGLFDGEKVVTNQVYDGLYQSFQQDDDKVDKKIWGVFCNEILNFIVVSLTLESKDSLSDKRNTKDSDITYKYERVLNGGMMLLNKIITLINSQEDSLQLDDSQFAIIQTILNQDTFWDYMGVVFDNSSFNSSMAISYLLLLRSIFLANKSQPTSQNPVCGKLSSSRGVYKLVAKKFFKNIKLKSHKNPANNLVFGSIILQFWGTLTVLTNFYSLEGTKKPKDGFWELGGSKSYQRLVDYLKLGPCNLDPVYYLLLDRFFKALISNCSIDFVESNMHKVILMDVLVTQIDKLKDYRYKDTAIECYTNYLRQLDPDLKCKFTEQGIIKIITGLALPSNRYKESKDNCIKLYTNYLNELDTIDGIIKIVNDDIIHSIKSGTINIDFIHTYCSILLKLKKESCLIVQDLVSLLSEDTEDVENNGSSTGFQILSILLENNIHLSEECTKSLVEFTQDIALHVEENNYKDIFHYLFAVWKNPHISQHLDNHEIVEDICTKALAANINLSEFINKVLSLFGWSLTDISKSSQLKEHVLSISDAPTNDSEWSTTLKFIDNPESFESLLSKVESDIQNFLVKFERFNHFDNVNLNFNNHNPLINIVTYCWDHYDNTCCQNFINFVVKSDGYGFLNQGLWSLIEKSTIDSTFVGIWNKLLDDDLMLKFSVEKIQQELEQLPEFDRGLISISNPLAQNIHMIPNKGTKTPKSYGLGIAKFLSYLPSTIDNTSLLFFCGVWSEYIEDLLFILNNHDPMMSAYMEVRDKLNTILQPQLKGLENNLQLCLSDFLQQSQNNDLLSLLVSKLNSGIDGPQLVYTARMIKKIITKSEHETVANFNNYNMDFNSLLKTPVKLGMLLSGLKPLLLSTKFDRIRNYVVAELLGVKENQVCDMALQWLVLSINFLDIDIDDVNYRPIPLNRLNMVLGQFGKWLESDFAYDQEFIPIRVQIINFLSCILNIYGDELQLNYWDLVSSLLTDSLNLIQIEYSNYELRNCTFKFLLTIKKQDINNDCIDGEWKKEVNNELLEIIFNEDILKYDESSNNTPLSICLDLMVRCIEIPSKDIPSEDIDKFYGVIVNNKFNVIKIKFSLLIYNKILEDQQQLVLDYQLKKPEDEWTIKLPSLLVSATDVDFNNFDEGSYLLSWFLIFNHFKDIGYSIRNEYVSEVKKLGQFGKLLDFIFDSLDIYNKSLMRSLFENRLENFGIEELNLLDQSLKDEGFFIGHLYYLCCKYLGSDVQAWFNNIRDVQDKKAIETFTTQYISQPLVEKILQEVDTNKANFANDDIMTIKLNTVTKEIRCKFDIDEQTMEMVIRVPSNYPLSNVLVEGPKRLGVKETQWKAWLLSSQRVISLTNGSISEAIEVFKKNVDYHFSGYEECAICYSILHQDHSLPSKTCATCLNKFHAACLYKWFKSSGSSTCPLCRSTFNFRTPK